MNLPIYQLVKVESAELEHVTAALRPDMNLRAPVALLLKHMAPDQQREVIGLVENWFAESSVSWRFPYAVYLVSDHGEALGRIPVVSEVSALPRFFAQKEGKTSVREGEVAHGNRLLQQQLRNTDVAKVDAGLAGYAAHHRELWALSNEAEFYRGILRVLSKRRGAHG